MDIEKKGSTLKWITRPIWLPWISEETHRRNLAQWEKEHGIDSGPQLNLTKNVFVGKVRNKKTGQVIDLNDEDYEFLEEEIKEIENGEE